MHKIETNINKVSSTRTTPTARTLRLNDNDFYDYYKKYLFLYYRFPNEKIKKINLNIIIYI
jgi:hypothetical protein